MVRRPLSLCHSFSLDLRLVSSASEATLKVIVRLPTANCNIHLFPPPANIGSKTLLNMERSNSIPTWNSCCVNARGTARTFPFPSASRTSTMFTSSEDRFNEESISLELQ
ncbi:unnamed protein product [Auanema sp. JU1783]|nr:unnamed protein product [Auanema sp. JU1783]